MLTNELIIGEGAKLEAGKIFMYANDSLTIEKDVKINSLIENECHVRDTEYDLYKCTSEDNLIANDATTLEFDTLISFYNEQFQITDTSDSKYARHARDLAHYIMNKWNIYILTLGSLEVTGSYIQGPRIGLCASDVNVYDSDIDASW